MGKTVATEQEAVADIVSGSTIAAGGFACGTLHEIQRRNRQIVIHAVLIRCRVRRSAMDL
jgi:acyl CoA:acetate/3-ketoacid CoA transferase alpha subunit